jgi:hypothetical protein
MTGREGGGGRRDASFPSSSRLPLPPRRSDVVAAEEDLSSARIPDAARFFSRPVPFSLSLLLAFVARRWAHVLELAGFPPRPLFFQPTIDRLTLFLAAAGTLAAPCEKDEPFAAPSATTG